MALRCDNKMQQRELRQQEESPTLENEMQTRVGLDQSQTYARRDRHVEQGPELDRGSTEHISAYEHTRRHQVHGSQSNVPGARVWNRPRAPWLK